MTAATYTSDLSDIYMFESTTNVTAYGGGGAGLSASPDLAMEGTNCVDKQITNAEKGFMYDNVSNFTIGADDHFFVWIMGSTPGLNDTRNNRGIVACIGDDTSNFVKFHVDGKDTLPLGGGKPYAIRFVNTTLTNYRTLVGTPGTTPSWIGGGLKTTATVKGANLGVDAARIGTGYDILYGTGADPEANFAGIASDDESTSEGVFQTAPGGYALQGKLRIGSAATECEFLDSDATIVIKDTIHSLTDFTEILVENASSILTLTRVTFSPLGTNNPGRFEVLTSTATVNLTSCTFNSGFGVTVLGTGSTFLNCTWINTGIITANGADLTGSEITGYEGTAGTSPLIWDVNTDPDGYLDNMSFTKGTAATHGIEFGTTSPLTMTVRGPNASGYNAADGQSDSFFHVKRTSGDVTINVIGGTGNFKYKSEGANVTVVLDPVTTTINVKDENDDDLQNARVLVEAGDGTGDLPFQASVTITRSGTTASVAHTAHGLANGAKVTIRGADQQEYNGVRTISNVSTDAYDYTVAGAPDSPATGTITSTGVVVEGLTSVLGVVSASRSFTVDQNVRGKVRKSTGTPRYKSNPPKGWWTDVVDNVTGLSKSLSMRRDD